MLSQDDEQAIEAVLNEFARRGQTGAAETAELFARVPQRPDVLEQLIGRARSRGLSWVVPMPVSGAQLSALIASSEPYPRKVEGLLAALRAQHPELASVLRKHVPIEVDPFVLATLASAMGQCGTALDGALLAPLLNHQDMRVVANALDAMRRLRAPPRAEVLVRMLESPDNRVRTNAIAFLGVLDPERALDLVRALVHSTEATTRAGVAYVLGELVLQDGATELLLEMNDREQNTGVLKQIALSLKKAATKDRAAKLVGPLYVAAEEATGAKRSVIAATLHEIAVEAGLAAADLQRLVAEHKAKSAPPPAPPAPVPQTTMSFARMPLAAPPGASPHTTAAYARMPVGPVTPASIPAGAAPAAPPVQTQPDKSTLSTQAFKFVPTPPVEGDEDLSFSNVWGTPQAPKSKSGATPVPSRGTPVPAPVAAGSRAPFLWLAGGVAALGLVGAMVTTLSGPGGTVAAATTGSAGSPDGVAASPGAPRGGRTHKGRDLPAVAPKRDAKGGVPPNPIAGHLGPAGAPVELTGTVVGVSSGKPVIEHKGQYYLVLHSSRAGDDLKRGASIVVAGKILGSSGDGLFYLEEARR